MLEQEKTNGCGRSLQVTFVAAVLLFAATSGCTEGAPFEGEISAVSSPVLELSWAKAMRTSQGIAIWGQVQQVNCCAYRVGGLIHLRALGLNGGTLAAADTSWGEFIARQLHSASFKALLPVPRGAVVSTIEIRFSLPAEPVDRVRFRATKIPG